MDDNVHSPEVDGNEFTSNDKINDDTRFSAEAPSNSSSLFDSPKPTLHDTNLSVYSRTKGSCKKNYCPYCKKFTTKFARHLQLLHADILEVRRFKILPARSKERQSIIQSIRLNGIYMHNTQQEHNSGQFIVSRCPLRSDRRVPTDYLPCSNCKTFVMKKNLRRHYLRCMDLNADGKRGTSVSSKKLVSRIHDVANDILRCTVFPVLQDCEVVDRIRYDELAILYGNKMCDKYTLPHQHDMIRAHLRLLGRFKQSLCDARPDITELTQVFHPKNYDSVHEAINLCAKFNVTIQSYETPTVATSLVTMIKKCCNIFKVMCLKQQNHEEKRLAEDFELVFGSETPISINRKVQEDAALRLRRKKVVLPTEGDIQKLHKYLMKIRDDSFKILSKAFCQESWLSLAEATLVLVQLFNRRRAGETERIQILDLTNRDTIDETEYSAIYNNLTQEEKDVINSYTRITLRGKLGRTVPLIMHQHIVAAIEMILKHRSAAGVPEHNPFIFGLPNPTDNRAKYLRACKLMRTFSTASGASMPSTLRGTVLRKHIATFCSKINARDETVSELAEFMGHREQIHRDVYRQTLAERQLVNISNVLEMGQGGVHEIPVRNKKKSTAAYASPPTSQMPRRNENFDSSLESNQSQQSEKSATSQRSSEYTSFVHCNIIIINRVAIHTLYIKWSIRYHLRTLILPLSQLYINFCYYCNLSNSWHVKIHSCVHMTTKFKEKNSFKELIN